MMSKAEPLHHEHATQTKAGAPWWRRGIIYRIYPILFQDSSGDRLSATLWASDGAWSLSPRWSGVDAIWISPYYFSPIADFGYDITDYCESSDTLALWITLVVKLMHELKVIYGPKSYRSPPLVPRKRLLSRRRKARAGLGWEPDTDEGGPPLVGDFRRQH